MKGWDHIKHLMALAHCGHDLMCYKEDMTNRPMVITFMKDNHGLYSTMFVSLEGSPPKAYAILQVCEFKEFKLIKENNELKLFNSWSGKSDDKICIRAIKVLYLDLTHYRTIRNVDAFKPVIKLSLKELLSRKDVIIMNAEAI